MRPWSLGLASVLLVAGLSGCGDGVSGGDCFPELPTVEPAAVTAGAQLTISSTGFTCDARYDDERQYSLQMGFEGRAEPVDLEDVDVTTDGSFRVTLTVPSTASPGGSAVSIRGSRYDEPCDDSSSCALYGASFVVLPAP
jgi:hypothetical protein